MGKNWRKLPSCIKLFYFCIMLFVLVWLFVHVTTKDYFWENQFTGHTVEELNDGWTDETGKTLELPQKYDIPAGTDFTIYHKVTEELCEQNYLLFRTDHTFVTATVNGSEVYRFGVADEIPFGQSPGSGWQLIPLDNAQIGDEIAITLNCPYEKYSGLLRTILFGTKSTLVSYIFWSGLAMLIMTIIPFFIGIFILIITPLFVQEYSFANMGLPILIVSVWSFTEARTWQLFFTNAYAMQTINFLTFSLAVPSLLWALQLLGFIEQSKKFYRMMTLDVLTALVLLLLQLTNTVDYFNTLFVIHTLQATNVLALVILFVKNWDNYRGIQRLMSIAVYATIAFAAILDLGDFYFWDTFGNGFFSRIAILSILIIAGISSLKQSFDANAENIEKRTFEQMAYTDNLTSLRNRRGFDEDVDKIAENPQAVSVLYADMNGLKRINDCMGHSLGDAALQTVAEHLQYTCGDQATCYRLGGDEFCILSTCLSPEELENRCTTTNADLAAYEEKFGGPIDISFAAERYDPAGNRTIYQCLTDTDRKMYEYKEKVYTTRERYR